MTEPQDENVDDDPWEAFRYDDEDPISLAEFADLDVASMPEGIQVWVMDDYFPDTRIWRDGDSLVCRIEDHMYTKFWEHKFSAYAFSEAMERAVRRLVHEGHPFEDPERDAEDVHIFMRWNLRVPITTPPETLVESVKAGYELVYRRAESILEKSDSVLVLGKDTGPSLDLLKRIAARLEELGYLTYIIKEQPDRVGEGVIQKVMRFALSAKFVVVENTEPSGHLYEIPHVVKAAECVTVTLQEEGKGATWMFEDAYAKHNNWHKIAYAPDGLDAAVDAAASWAEKFVKQFGVYQAKVLPWMRPPGSP